MTYIKKLGAIVGSFCVSSLIFLVFEFVNSRFFPFPQGFDMHNIEAVRTFTASLPWYAFILVGAGWAVGSFLGGYTMGAWLRPQTIRPAFVLGVVLTVVGLWNNIMLGSPVWFTIFGLCVFVVMARRGYRRWYRTHEGHKKDTIA